MNKFKDLGLTDEIVTVLSKLKYKKTFEVQDKIVPLIMQGKNVVFTSRTGSGKTLAYLIGFLKKMNKKTGIQLLVVVPTRELCVQVNKEFTKICEPLGINVGMLFGGRDIGGDHRTTRKKNQIMVGTPGRLIQHINEKNIKVGEVKYLVFDESDQMFDNGFSKDCAYIKERSSNDVQMILSSATISEKVQKFITTEIVDFELLKIGKAVPENIIQEKIFCEIKNKNDLLLDFFKDKKFKRAMIFVNRKSRTYTISESLTYNGYKAKYLNSDLEQRDRQERLNQFKEGSTEILVVTDIAARGLHIKDVDIIINYDVPTKREFYVHRIGRTGRKDKKGYALTIVCPEDDDRFANIEFEYELDVKEIKLDL